ncbi:hypothetical protein GALMADRAFT_230087 [Galerina marginata CBS 339.88]|uniref:Uncharacterized protein n=1 Tax=Galerina marginata (strain CBS 339.88) TaxID=685588 RepID=A0A067SS27_GALM3|nr:hypothetical protein GALMADRAFT_230087 [Galerina marginata CBS 339.88]
MEQRDTFFDEFQRKWLSEAVFETWKKRHWLSFDEDWLVLRDAYARSVSDRSWWMSEFTRYRSRQIGPLYDLTRGLSSIAIRNESHTVRFSGYHCVQDLTSSVIGESARIFIAIERRDHSQYLQKLLGGAALDQPFATFSDILMDPTVGFLQDENAFIFLSRYRHPHPILLQHFAELHVRILNHLYPNPPRTDISDSWKAYPSYADAQWLYTYGKAPWRAAEYDIAFDIRISTQLSLLIESLFKSAADPYIDNIDFFASVHAQKFGDLLRYAVVRQSEDTVQPILSFLATIIDSYTLQCFGRRSDFIFYASSFYARSLLVSDPWSFMYGRASWDNNPLVEAFLPVLRRYIQERGIPDVALGERLGVPALSDDWWEFLHRSWDEDDCSSQEELKIIVPTSRVITSSPSLYDTPLTSAVEPPVDQLQNKGTG